MGSEEFYPEEAPGPGGHSRRLLDRRRTPSPPPTSAASSRATGYVTLAERAARRRRLPGRRPRPARPRARSSSAGPRGPVDRSTTTAAGGSTCRARAGSGRSGPGSDDQRPRPPPGRPRRVRGRRRRTRSGPARRFRPRRSGSTRPAAGSTARVFAWGDEHFPGGSPMANTWQGEFPWQNLKLDGYDGTVARRRRSRRTATASTTCAGNVWEWTADLVHAAPRRRGDARRRAAPPPRSEPPASASRGA